MKQEKIEQFIKKHSLLSTGSNVIVGVSGGPDSIALLHYFWQIREKWSLTIVAAHVDHMFRGSESYEDLLFVKQFCKEHQIAFEGKSIDVPLYANNHHLSSQVAARECRYDYFKLVMEKYNGDYLALAHHADDQVETMLMRMVRGSFGQGLAGIPVKRSFFKGMIIRPFLCLTRNEIEQYISDHKLSFRIDPSNEKDSYQRNRFRHHILPYLRKENPNVAERFQTLSELLIDDQQLLDKMANEEIAKILVEKSETKIAFPINAFLRLPISLQRRGIHLILKYLYKSIPSTITTIHINQLLSLLGNEHPSGALNFPKGLTVTRSYNQCTIAFSEKEVNREAYCYEIPIPGEIKVDDLFMLKAEWTDHIPMNINSIDFFICSDENIAFPIHIRNRKIGDRMTIKGMNGSKKIKDIFIDQKVPLEERDLWPLVEDANGNILWLPRLKKSAFSIDHQKNNERSSHHYLQLQYISNNEGL